jgi:hypothetical protein
MPTLTLVEETKIEVQEIVGIVPAMIHYLDLEGKLQTVKEAHVRQIDPALTETLKDLS